MIDRFFKTCKMSLSKKFVLLVVICGFFVFSVSTIFEVYRGYKAGLDKISKNDIKVLKKCWMSFVLSV